MFKVCGVVVCIFLVLFCIFEIEKWKYNECKKVGHGTFYCLVEGSK